MFNIWVLEIYKIISWVTLQGPMAHAQSIGCTTTLAWTYF